MTKSRNVKPTVARTVASQSKRQPRQRISGRLGSDTILKGTELCTSLTVANGGSGMASYIPLIAGTTSSRAVYTFINVAKNYQKFIYRPGTHFRYQPNVGLSTAGTVYVAYIDNPEAIKDYIAASGAIRLDIVKGQANMRSYPVWQEFIMPLTATPRQRMFTTDVTTDLTDADTLNRVCQGAYIFGVELPTTVSADTTIGRPILHVNLELQELSATPVT